jgi:hypothetical protein
MYETDTMIVWGRDNVIQFEKVNCKINSYRYSFVSSIKY